MSNSTEKIWQAVPHDPLVFRDGKPSEASESRSLPVELPFPSSLAGAVRTLSGAQANGGLFPAGDQETIDRVLGYQVAGPFLFDLKKGAVLFPAPEDALLLKQEPYNEQRAKRVPLRPTDDLRGARTNLPDGLQLVTPATQSKTKAHPKAPAFWHWDQMRAWLSDPQPDDDVSLATLGIPGLPTDVRTHVSIRSDSGTAEEGALFQTAGWTFVHVAQKEARLYLNDAAELALLVRTDAPLQADLGALGGESRVVAWQPVDGVLPACPDEVRQSILSARCGRLILATPAHFEQGFLPGWVCEHPSGVRLRIVGAAVGRPVHVSGWNYEVHAPKPSRRLAPAGSVYFFKIEAGDEAAIERFIDETWLRPISDDAQDRRDGFGVALLGAWKAEEA